MRRGSRQRTSISITMPRRAATRDVRSPVPWADASKRPVGPQYLLPFQGANRRVLLSFDHSPPQPGFPAPRPGQMKF